MSDARKPITAAEGLRQAAAGKREHAEMIRGWLEEGEVTRAKNLSELARWEAEADAFEAAADTLEGLS